MTMDLRSLKYVSAAVRFESITKAAEHLHVAQSAVSRAIKILEDELGVTLLVRHSHGVSATPEGVRFVESAEKLLGLAQHLRNEMRASAAEPAGEVRFGFPPSHGEAFISALVCGFTRSNPRVSFVLREGLTGELRDELLADRLDIAMMLDHVRHENLASRPLFAEDTWLVGAPSAWPFGRRPIEPAELDGLPLVHTTMVGETLRKATAKQKIHWRVVAQGDVTRVAPEIVRAGLAFWLIPYGMIAEQLASGVLAGAPVRSLEMRRALFWRSDRPHSRAVAAFIDEIGKAVTAMRAARPPLVRDAESA